MLSTPCIIYANLGARSEAGELAVCLNGREPCISMSLETLGEEWGKGLAAFMTLQGLGG